MASSTAILDALETAKLITRLRNAADRRKINVFLTPAGAALERPLMACAADANKRARKGLSTAEVAQLFALTGHIIENFRTLRAAAAPRGRVRRNMPRAADKALPLPSDRSYFLTAASTTDFNCASPFSMSRPTIRSMFMNRHS